MVASASVLVCEGEVQDHVLELVTSDLQYKSTCAHLGNRKSGSRNRCVCDLLTNAKL